MTARLWRYEGGVELFCSLSAISDLTCSVSCWERAATEGLRCGRHVLRGPCWLPRGNVSGLAREGLRSAPGPLSRSRCWAKIETGKWRPLPQELVEVADRRPPLGTSLRSFANSGRDRQAEPSGTPLTRRRIERSPGGAVRRAVVSGSPPMVQGPKITTVLIHRRDSPAAQALCDGLQCERDHF